MNIPIVRPFLFVICSVLFSSCFTQVSPSTSEFRKPAYPPQPDRALQLAPEDSGRVLLGIENGKSLKHIAQRLEWEGFTICHRDDEIQTLAAQQRFRDEQFVLQINLIKMDGIIEAVMFWRPALGIISHPMAPRSNNPQRWHKAFRDHNLSSNNSRAFAVGIYHLLHIPHHSLEFKTGFHPLDSTTGFCS